jgi:hypothetical protein
MTTASTTTDRERGDLLQAVEFAQRCFERWQADKLIRESAARTILDTYAKMREDALQGKPIEGVAELRSAELCWSCKRALAPSDTDCDACGAPAHTPDTERLRFLIFTCLEVKRFYKDGVLTMTEGDALLLDGNQRIASLRRKLDGERIPFAVAAEPRSSPPPMPRRNLMEILLDPRSIQWLLVSGGALLVVGLVIWLAASGFFEDPKFLAVCLGLGNALLLGGGWALILRTRYQTAGRALTLLACLVMPLNLWFYNAQGLIVLSRGDPLWLPALVCCVLYAASARILRDPTFVYVFVAGITMTGLLILADQHLQRFEEIAAPSVMLVCFGLVCIHVERAFVESESPFSRRRFGLAFFWSGHVVLAGGMLLVLGAQVCGGWLYPLFEPIYRDWEAVPSPIVTAEWGRWLALCLVLAGIYAYSYSDLVVRRVGVYIYLAVFCLLWAEVLILNLLPWKLPLAEVAIITLAVTALAINLSLAKAGESLSRLVRLGPPVGLFLSVIPVALGVLLHARATSPLLSWWRYQLSWTYVGAMLSAALSCRASAHLFRHTRPSLSLTYFFGTGAATLVGAAGLLKTAYPWMAWKDQAPLLMLIPLLYLLAARLYRGHSQEKPLIWLARAATVVMLISSIGAAFKGFLLVERDTLNLLLAAFFAEATLFYLVEAVWRKHSAGIAACTLTACAAVWQLLKYVGVEEEYYVLTFAIVGLLLLIAYRFAVLENLNLSGLASVAFHGGNALLSLAFVAGALIVLSRLIAETAKRDVLVLLLFALIAIGLAALALVRQPAWRRWYATTAIVNAALIVLVLAILGTLTPGEKLEIAATSIGLLLLVVGHVGWFREQERHDDLVTLSLVLGSLLMTVPLSIAVLYCRYTRAFDTFHTINEVGMLVAGLVLLATGFMFQIKSTTLSGAFMSVLYLVSLVLYLTVPKQLQTTAVYIMVGGGTFFAIGLLLSLYRDRLLALPERIKRREGVFRVLTWR